MSRLPLNKQKRLWFICNSCIAIRRTVIGPDRREGQVCPSCGLNARQRAVLLAVQKIVSLKIKKRG